MPLRLLVGLLTALAAAAEPVWDWRPPVCYRQDRLDLHWRGQDRCRVRVDDGPEQVLHAIDGQFRLQVPCRSIQRQLRIEAADYAVRLRCLEPGQAAQLQLDAAGELRLDGDPVLLVLDRREAEIDRRWAWLRRDPVGGFDPSWDSRLKLQIAEPAWGQSGLAALVVAARKQELSRAGMTLHLPSADAYHGWLHRQYRQYLAWLIDDCRRRGLRRLVLVEPPILAAEAERQEVLSAQIFDVARAYGCEAVRTKALRQELYWQDASGLLQTQLNEAGETALQELVAAHLGRR